MISRFGAYFTQPDKVMSSFLRQASAFILSCAWCVFLSSPAAFGAELVLAENHCPVPKVEARTTPADPASVRLKGWLGRYVDSVRDNFVLQSNVVDMYLRPLEVHGDT